MNCQKLSGYLNIYVLGDLDRKVEREIEEHLALCPTCADAVLEARRELADVGAALKSELVAPSAMLDAVEQAMQSHPARRFSKARLAFGLATASAAALFGAFFVLHRAPVMPSTLEAVLMSQPLDVKNVDAPMDESSDLDMLARKVGFRLESPGLLVSGAKLVQCQTCDFGQGDAPLMTYRKQATSLFVIEIPFERARLSEQERRSRMGRNVYCCTHGPMSVVAFKRGQCLVMVAAALSEGELIRVIGTQQFDVVMRIARGHNASSV